MTVSTQILESPDYLGDGVIKDLPFNFYYDDESHVELYEKQEDDTYVLSDLPFSVSRDSANSESGNITLESSLVDGLTVKVVRNTTKNQLQEMPQHSPFYPEIHEKKWDKLTAMIQEICNRGLSFPAWYSGDTALPAPGNEPRLLSHNSDGDLVWSDVLVVPQGSVIIINDAVTGGAGFASSAEVAKNQQIEINHLHGYADKADAVANFDPTKSNEAVILSDDGGDFIHKSISEYPDTLASAVSTYTGTACGVAIDLGSGKGFLVRRDMNGFISAKWFKVLLGEYVNSRYALEEAIQYGIDNLLNVYCPKGVYTAVNNNFRLGGTGVPTEFRDCKGIHIYGDGDETIFRTTSTNGADVFQCNAVSNLTIRNLLVTAVITGANPTFGSNGVSLTNGYENINIDIKAKHLWGTDKGYIDGGKAVSIQSSANTLNSGRANIKVHAIDCAEAFSSDATAAVMQTKQGRVDADVIAEDCRVAFRYYGDGGTIAEAISEDYDTGFNVTLNTLNCQADVQLRWAHGIRINGNVMSTKTKDELSKNSEGRRWISNNLAVVCFYGAKVDNAQINLSGNKQYCDTKFKIGGGIAGSSGQPGYSDNCDIYLDIGGTAIVGFDIINAGGLVIRHSNIRMTRRTDTDFPATLKLSSQLNTYAIGEAHVLMEPLVKAKLNFALGADGATKTATIRPGGTDSHMIIQGLTGNAGDKSVEIQDVNGLVCLAIRTGGGFVIDSPSSGNSGTIFQKIPVHYSNGTLRGYLPIVN